MRSTLPKQRPPSPSRRPSAASQLRLRRGQTWSHQRHPPEVPHTVLLPHANPRRGSAVSEAVSETCQSLMTSADDVLFPWADSQTRSRNFGSPWLYIPLLFGIGPAVGGMLFENGSAVVADILLLFLAIVCLAWSTMLPWRWYESARTNVIPQQVAQGLDLDNSSGGTGQNRKDGESKAEDENPRPEEDVQHAAVRTHTPLRPYHPAVHELRRHELAALATCFVSPLFGAWLLSVIREHLSIGLIPGCGPMIFILAAELQPASHLLKLVQARTLHLQRVVAAESPSPQEHLPLDKLVDLSKRLDEIETHIVESKQLTKDKGKQPQGTDKNSGMLELVAEVHQLIRPDLQALKDALQKQDRRNTALSESTDKRLGDFEARLTALWAYQHSHTSDAGGIGPLILRPVQWVSTVVTLPVQIAWTIVCLPVRTAAWCFQGLGKPVG